MPDFMTRDGQIIRDATDEAIAAVKTLERIADEQAAAAKMFGAPRSGPSAIERHTAIRTAQYEAERDGRAIPTPATYVAPEIRIDPARMTLAERWGAWREPRQG
jgi:hypothetical protein